MPTTMNVFQDDCAKTAIYRDAMKTKMERLCYTVLGLCSEAGEVAGKLKKVMRDDGSYISEEKARAMMAEIGDTMWYCAMTCAELTFSLDECAEFVVYKLKQRKEKDTLGGSGDNR